jgi:hypothetical protein
MVPAPYVTVGAWVHAPNGEKSRELAGRTKRSRGARALTWPQIAVHHQWIEEQLGAPVTVATIAQRLRDDRQVEVSESTVRRYIATSFTEQRLEERVTVPRGAVEPGSEAQIDYGKLGMWCDPVSGRRVAVGVFAMILSCSRALFVQPVLRMDQTSWNASHVAAFEFFGGAPAHSDAGGYPDSRLAANFRRSADLILALPVNAISSSRKNSTCRGTL